MPIPTFLFELLKEGAATRFLEEDDSHKSRARCMDVIAEGLDVIIGEPCLTKEVVDVMAALLCCPDSIAFGVLLPKSCWSSVLLTLLVTSSLICLFKISIEG